VSTDAAFPIFLRLEGRRVLVVGGGAMAAQRVAQLASAGARVVVVAPEIRDEIPPRAAEVHRRPFQASDVDGAWFAVAAAPPEVNRAVAAAAEARQVFVNAVDDLSAASAWCGGVIRRGGVLVALSTEARAPALAGLLREGLDALVPQDIDQWVAEAERLRPQWKAAGVPIAERRALLLEALNALYDHPEGPERSGGSAAAESKGRPKIGFAVAPESV
jgi:uroporphyrin-III C-methyltransferase/precorrin-2 dehydrogenase/sirohydrochlorin ferrochelatase